MFKVYKESMSLSIEIAEFETEQEAIDFCEYYNWELKDENDFWWDLAVDEECDE